MNIIFELMQGRIKGWGVVHFGQVPGHRAFGGPRRFLEPGYGAPSVNLLFSGLIGTFFIIYK